LPLSIEPVDTADNKKDPELRAGALAHAIELAGALRGHEKELSPDGAALAQRAAEAAEGVGKLLGEKPDQPR
jgi:hypothetical protein